MLNKPKRNTEEMNKAKKLKKEQRMLILHKICADLVKTEPELPYKSIFEETIRLNYEIPIKTLGRDDYKKIIDGFRNSANSDTSESSEVTKLKNYIKHQASIIDKLREQNNALKTALLDIKL